MEHEQRTIIECENRKFRTIIIITVKPEKGLQLTNQKKEGNVYQSSKSECDGNQEREVKEIQTVTLIQISSILGGRKPNTRCSLLTTDKANYTNKPGFYRLNLHGL
ncbi:hypothetical protein CIPAW_05G251400 [Carya illinoinensis]|uniref:Uncharacterized protein n=1 Tax=Carya illinoinensis TaxID=32201 RepID=A0A8T1QPM4_CARIL|nr:hypothetical protein CIPAW_06G017000 [Carya illinoinensis]KAG6655942.1 hypothetical protein CIPAW_05G251400 [Carya illinoinensis]